MSTAALMHGRIDDRLPRDAEPLSLEGYFCVVTDTTRPSWGDPTIGFHVVHVDRPYHHIYSATLAMPSMDWRNRLSPSRVNLGGQVALSASLARVASEVVFYASELGRILDESEQLLHADRIAAAEEEERKRQEAYELRRAEERARREKELAERRALVEARNTLTKERKEMLQWHIGDKFRLKRIHHRTGKPMAATVFGEIIDFVDMNDGTIQMRTVSEKGKPMSIYLHCITSMEVKEHEADKKYSRKLIPSD